MKCKNCGWHLSEFPSGGYYHVKWNGKYWKAIRFGNMNCDNPEPKEGGKNKK